MQFLLFAHFFNCTEKCPSFLSLFQLETKSIVWQRLTHYDTMPYFHAIKIAVENIVRKGQIACNKQFIFFSQCFLHYVVLIFHFKCTLKCRTAIRFNLDQSKILSSGKDLRYNRALFKCKYLETLKVAPQIFGRKFYKNNKKSSLHSQSLLIFIQWYIRVYILIRWDVKNLNSHN